MNKLFNTLSNTGCIVYDVEVQNNNGLPAMTIKGRSLMKPTNNNGAIQNFLDIEDGMWYTPSQVGQPRLNVEKFKSLTETFSMLNDSEIEISNIEDLKKIYAVNLLRKINEVGDDFKKIDFISNLL